MNDQSSVAVPAESDIQAEAVQLLSGSGAPLGLAKVDCASQLGDLVLVTGWCSAPGARLGMVDGQGLPAGQVWRQDRPDVRSNLGLEALELGFVILLDGPASGLRLKVESGGAVSHFALRFAQEVPADALLQAAGAIMESLATVATGSAEWRARVRLLPDRGGPPEDLFGNVDTAITVARCGGLASGWVVSGEGVALWLEDERGRAVALDKAFRSARPDVHMQGPVLAAGCARPGFMVEAVGLGGARQLRIGGSDGAGRFALPWVQAEVLPPVSRVVAERLFSIPVRRADMAARIRAVELPFLARVQAMETAMRERLKTAVRWFGTAPEAPRVSVIVPLYGRIDLIEHQMLDFVADRDFTRQAELIYVIDDPGLEDGVFALAPRLSDIVGLPVCCVSNGANGGFSAANNLGAATARGETLIFMNSDVFPKSGGWLSRLIAPLDRDEIGMVAPRLLFPDGGIQHAGMVPRWRAALALWTNHHPMMGFDPALDPAKDVTETDLVTGACVALRRRDFDAVGGWCADYLIGDFEDSDLCLRLRERGLAAAYHPGVELIHMERQSMPHSGEGDFRQRVTLFNAVLYNSRWHDRLREIAG